MSKYIGAKGGTLSSAKWRRRANAKPAKYPGFIEPSLATLRDKIPAGNAWEHEIKYDGYRLQIHKHDNDYPPRA